MIACWWGLRRTTILHPAETEPSLKMQFQVARSNPTFRNLLGTFFLQALATSGDVGRCAISPPCSGTRESTASCSSVWWPRASSSYRCGQRSPTGSEAGYLLSSLLAGTLLLLTARVVPLAASLAFVALCGIGYAGMQMFPAVDAARTPSPSMRRNPESVGQAYTGSGPPARPPASPSDRRSCWPYWAWVASSPPRPTEVVVQPESAINGTLLVVTVLPALLLLASLPLLLRYDLTD